MDVKSRLLVELVDHHRFGLVMFPDVFDFLVPLGACPNNVCCSLKCPGIREYVGDTFGCGCRVLRGVQPRVSLEGAWSIGNLSTVIGLMASVRDTSF